MVVRAQHIAVCTRIKSAPCHHTLTPTLKPRPLGVLIVSTDNACAPALPRWLGCEVPVVPASQCCCDGAPVLHPLRSDAPLTAEQPAGARTELLCQPLPATELLRLLEVDTVIRVMDVDARDGHYRDLADDLVLRMVRFRSHEEAARRAVLLLAMSWDPWLGALLQARSHTARAQLSPWPCSTTTASQSQPLTPKTSRERRGDHTSHSEQRSVPRQAAIPAGRHARTGRLPQVGAREGAGAGCFRADAVWQQVTAHG